GPVRAFVEASVRMPASFPFRLAARVVATDAVVEWTVGFRDDGPPVVTFTRHPRRGAAETRTPREPNPYVAECRHFARVVRGDADPGLLDATGARDGLRIVAAARESLARGGARVALGEG